MISPFFILSLLGLVLPQRNNDKDDPTYNRTKTLGALPEPKDNLICPIRLLLIVALRTGNVEATSIDELRTKVLSTQRKMVVWKYPQRPVIPSNRHKRLNLDTPAETSQMRETIAYATRIAGVLVPLTTHDLRRGSARDLANLPSPVVGIATKQTAELFVTG